MADDTLSVTFRDVHATFNLSEYMRGHRKPFKVFGARFTGTHLERTAGLKSKKWKMSGKVLYRNGRQVSLSRLLEDVADGRAVSSLVDSAGQQQPDEYEDLFGDYGGCIALSFVCCRALLSFSNRAGILCRYF